MKNNILLEEDELLLLENGIRTAERARWTSSGGLQEDKLSKVVNSPVLVLTEVAEIIRSMVEGDCA